MILRKVEPDAQDWKAYMPRWGNGGVPKQKEVNVFHSAITNKPELRQKVIGELRERAHGQSALQLSIVSAGLAVFAIFIGITPSPSDWISQGADVQDFIGLFQGLMICIGAFFVVGMAQAVYLQQRARHAASYLAAYEENYAQSPTTSVTGSPQAGPSTGSPVSPAASVVTHGAASGSALGGGQTSGGNVAPGAPHPGPPVAGATP